MILHWSPLGLQRTKTQNLCKNLTRQNIRNNSINLQIQNTTAFQLSIFLLTGINRLLVINIYLSAPPMPRSKLCFWVDNYRHYKPTGMNRNIPQVRHFAMVATLPKIPNYTNNHCGTHLFKISPNIHNTSLYCCHLVVHSIANSSMYNVLEGLMLC